MMGIVQKNIANSSPPFKLRRLGLGAQYIEKPSWCNWRCSLWACSVLETRRASRFFPLSDLETAIGAVDSMAGNDAVSSADGPNMRSFVTSALLCFAVHVFRRGSTKLVRFTAVTIS
jgi:hypothetical protein